MLYLWIFLYMFVGYLLFAIYRKYDPPPPEAKEYANGLHTLCLFVWPFFLFLFVFSWLIGEHK